MKNGNTIQVILIGVSIVAILIAVVMFSVFKVGGGGSKTGPILVWGTLPEITFDNVLQKMSEKDIRTEHITYIEKTAESFDEELLQSIAENNSPDLVIVDEKQIIQNQNRMITIPFESYPLRTFQDTFIEQSNLLVSQGGILGFPLMVDPLVMYYNRNILSDTGFARVPQTWTEILAVAPVMTIKDSSFNISRSAIALGSFDNIRHSKDIYLMFLLQSGNPVIKRSVNSESKEEQYASSLTENQNVAVNAATNTFTQFANPNVTVYSWNRSLPDSQTMFIAGDLGFYFGFASELDSIRRLNPNLNFDIALVPQPQNPVRRTTFGSMNILTIPRTSTNVPGAIEFITTFTSPEVQIILAEEFNKASVRRDVLASSDPSDPYQEIINRSAIMSQAVLEPDKNRMSAIIKELIDGIVSGQFEVNQAITRAHERINLILNQ